MQILVIYFLLITVIISSSAEPLDNVSANENESNICKGEALSCGEITADLLDGQKEDIDKVGSEEIATSSMYGVMQVLTESNEMDTLVLIKKMNRYMRDEVFVKESYSKVAAECKNRDELCAFWATIGECEKNPSYMSLSCAPACFTCELLDFDRRCPRDYSLVDAVKPGDLNRKFERIAYGNEFASFRKIILSRPVNENSNDPRIKNGPWIIAVDDFLTEKETNVLIDYGAKEGYERSESIGEITFDGTLGSRQSRSRTSENSWCKTVCFVDPVVKGVLKKIENITGISDGHSEHLQLLRYTKGQFYGVHHDYIPHQNDRNIGPRIITVFLYLNDVEKGGGTNFPVLDVTVMPKRGRILIWPNVQDSNPILKDSSTEHQVLHVEKGVKYGANAWLHLRDFKREYNNDCT